ncbi:MAG: SagB/ThcOx family dehydrogenase [Bacteroidales bacterium]|nr:SagB/ThcOx family dehydrogenase [Bacteroidales bacterium]
MTAHIKLPPPQKDLKFPLMQALEKRRTRRKWKEKELSLQEISNLLWAACGVTAPATPKSKSKRTAPSARNSQTIKVYLTLPNALFLYDEMNHALIPLLAEDIRMYIGNQKMMKSAPAGLVYVADFSKLKSYTGVDDNRKWFVAGTETGFISQNVYLYCASANLSTAIIGLVNRDQLHKIMKLQDYQKIMYTQAVGIAQNLYLKEESENTD